MRELVADKKCGLIVQPGNVDQLAAALEWMCENPTRCRTWGGSDLEYVSREHSSQAHGLTIGDICHQFYS